MPRARKGAARNKSRNRILREARGHRGARGRHKYRAKNALMRAGCYAYRDRRSVKRDMRALWITRINAACRMRGARYSQVMNGLKLAGILLNRKMLSQIAIEDPKLFDEIVKQGLEASKATPANTA